eukprot:Colp12_sorted_trinity150504_noHs@2531
MKFAVLLIAACMLQLAIAQLVNTQPKVDINLGDALNFNNLFGGLNNDCEFTCPAGEKAVNNPDHVQTTNGCGVAGLTIENVFNFTPCCDEHDICYDTCGANKKKCDDKFKKCLLKVCKKLRDTEEKEKCQGNANLYYIGTASFGCAAYSASQENACMCVAEDVVHDEL